MNYSMFNLKFLNKQINQTNTELIELLDIQLKIS